MGEPNPDPIMPAKSVFKGQGKASRSIQAMGSDEWNKRAKQVSKNHTGAAPPFLIVPFIETLGRRSQ